jgi:hypothetical protein
MLQFFLQLDPLLKYEFKVTLLQYYNSDITEFTTEVRGKNHCLKLSYINDNFTYKWWKIIFREELNEAVERELWRFSCCNWSKPGSISIDHGHFFHVLSTSTFTVTHLSENSWEDFDT